MSYSLFHEQFMLRSEMRQICADKFIFHSAGMFWLHDAYHDGPGFYAWRRQWAQTALAIATILSGAFICVAGLYVTIRGIVDAYASGQLPPPFTC